MPDQPPVARFRVALAALTGTWPTAAVPLGIAVSGGADSLALLLLAHAAHPGAIVAATVDHGLRAGAAAEARQVAMICAELAVPHRILTGGWPADGSPQDRARRLRYRLLADWARAERIGWIATAHHLDDQAETFLMRAARGAGAAGLAGVRARVELAGIAVVRPLLGWRRETLGGIVAAAGLDPVDDPSNRDPAYDRTAFRALIAGAARLRPEGLARAAANLADAEAALAWTAARLADERLTVSDAVVRFADPHGLPRELRRRLLASALARAGGTSPRGDALDRLLRLLDAGRPGMLGGVLVRPGADWSLVAAPPRRA